jgi:hypothetical protein
LAFSLPQTREKIGEQSRRLLGKHSADGGQLVVQPLILT